MKLKICGITNQNDLRFCARYADAIGFIVEYPKSKRSLTIEKAKKLIDSSPPFISTVPVIPDFSKALIIYNELKPSVIQLHGNETADQLKEFQKQVQCKIIKACGYENALEYSKYSDAILIDDKYSKPDYSKIKLIIKKIKKPVIIAGNLNCENILTVLEKIEPYGVDICSGVESEPGIKDKKKVRQFKSLLDIGGTVGHIIQNKKKMQTHEFYNSLRNNDKIHIISEIKPASPSEGKLKEVNGNLNMIVKVMEKEGASAISVLVEKEKFNGSINLLKNVRKTTSLPILAKGFFYETNQIDEIKKAGANAFLLMIRLIESQGKNPKDLISYGSRIGLDCVVEVNNHEELKTALKLDAKIIEINNRDIYGDMHIDFKKIRIGKNLSKDIILISASGVDKTSDIKKIYDISESRVDAILVGSSIMKALDINKKIKDLVQAGRDISN